MKKYVRVYLIGFLMFILTGCSSGHSANSPIASPTPASSPQVDRKASEDKKQINVWCYVDEITNLIYKFQELHPEFDYEIVIHNFATMDMDYNAALSQALAEGGPEAPDLYSVEISNAIKFTQGDAYPYAADYKELGIDTDTLVKSASLPQYMIELGTNPEGRLVALGYNAYQGAFIYRRSIAKEVWGTDEPSMIGDIIGPGWDEFFEAAAELKAKGYGICSGIGDLWIPVERSAEQGWVVDGRLVIDPKREAFLDHARRLLAHDYTNQTKQWSDSWYADMSGEGDKNIFGFFGPAWFIQYIMLPFCGGETVGEGTYGDWAVCDPTTDFYWGGSMLLANKATDQKAAVGEIIQWITLDLTEKGCQYLWATGEFTGNKEIAASAELMKNLEGKLDFLGGQDLYQAFLSSGEAAPGTNNSEYDSSINSFWLTQVHEYAEGRKSREQALADFKLQVAKVFPDIVVD